MAIPTAPGRNQNVVGVGYYQQAFRGARPGAATLELRCEPNNPYDANAVAVVLSAKKIGHLSGHMAEGYQPILSALESEGPVIHEGELRKDEGAWYATIHLPDQDRLSVWAQSPPEQRPRVGFESRRVRLKRLGKYEAELGALLGQQDRTQVSAVVTAFETPSGKYKGKPSLRATVNGTEVGLLPAQYREEAPELFDTLSGGGSETFMVWITRYPDSGGVSAVFDYYPPPAGLPGSTPPSAPPPPPPPPR